MTRVSKVLPALVGVVVCSQAQALPVTFSFDGTCQASCYGLIGPQITGGIVTSDIGLSNGVVTNYEIANFWMDFGLFHFDNSNSELGATSLMLSDDGQTFTSGLFRIDGVFGLFPGNNLDFVANEGSNTWTFILPFVGDPSGNGTFTRAATSVPEPATLSLLGAGLLAVGLMRRRKRTPL